MGFQKSVESESFIANSDLSAAKHRIVELHSTAGKCEIAALGEGYGVLQNEPKSGEHATVAKGGIARIQVGTGGVSIGGYVTAAASGYGLAVLSGQAAVRKVIGRALTAAASGMTADVDLNYRFTFQASGGAI
jgi:hypothetical protein